MAASRASRKPERRKPASALPPPGADRATSCCVGAKLTYSDCNAAVLVVLRNKPGSPALPRRRRLPDWGGRRLTAQRIIGKKGKESYEAFYCCRFACACAARGPGAERLEDAGGPQHPGVRPR